MSISTLALKPNLTGRWPVALLAVVIAAMPTWAPAIGAADAPAPTPAPPNSTPHATQGTAMQTNGMLADIVASLDLNRPGLEAVKAAATADTIGAGACSAAWRDYLRARAGFKHPVNRGERKKSRGQCASAAQLKAADSALKNILIASPNYAPHDFGAKIDWSKNPTPDSEWLWQLHRMSSWGALARAYWHTGDEKYAQCWARQMQDWVRVNLVNPKPAYAWRTIEAGIRGNGWIEEFQYFVEAEAFSPEVAVAFTAACLEHGRYLNAALEKHPEGNNWRLMEAEGLAAIALCFPEFKAAPVWRERAFKVLKDNLKRQVRADGMHYEQCFNYHQGCISWFARTAILARMNGYETEFGPEYYQTIEAMCAALLKMCFPDGTMAQFGDGHSTQSCTAVLGQWAEVFQREDFRYAGSGRRAGKPPAEISCALADSGFYALRSGWDAQATCLILKCGPDGGWHCQPDNGSFELYAGGRRLTPDSGCYVYSGDAAGRAWFRQTRVHQTLTLDNKDIRYAATQKLWQTGEDFDALVVENGSYANLTHRRAVLYIKPDLFVLIDEAIGAGAGELELHFTPPPGAVTVAAETRRVTTLSVDHAAAAGADPASATQLLIAGVVDPAVRLVAEEGQVSFEYGHKQPRQACAYVRKKTADEKAVRFVTVLLPYKGVAPAVKIEAAGQPAENVAGGGRAEYRVTVGGKTHRVGYDLTGKKAWHALE